MSLMGYVSFDLNDYDTAEQLRELLDELDDDISTLNGFRRGAVEKLDAMEADDD